MNSLQKTLFIIFYKIYKLIKHILYKIFIFPFQYSIWRVFRFLYRHFADYKLKFREIYKGKILTYFGILFVLFICLKFTQVVFYDPSAFEVEIKWPSRIRVLRKKALLHWINLAIIFTFFQFWSWIFYRIHHHYTDWGTTMYIEMWFYAHLFFHGIWWDFGQVYINMGAGYMSVLAFVLVHLYSYFSHQLLETFEDMEYDWDDLDAKEGGTYRTIDIAINEDNKEVLQTAHQLVLDELCWDVFGSPFNSKDDDPNLAVGRWGLWYDIFYPPLGRTDDERWQDEIQLVKLSEPINVWEFYAANFCEAGVYVYPELAEGAWSFWTEYYQLFQIFVFPVVSPIRRFYYKTFRPFTNLIIPLRRIRAVGEYSRLNWRYKVWLLRLTDIPVLDTDFYAVDKDLIAYGKQIYYIIRAFLLFWWRRTTIRSIIRGYKNILFTKKYKKQLKKLRAWGSINYSFFGKKNYKPKN
jgi:hypothetical protein